MMLIPRRNDFDFMEDIFEDPFFSHNEMKLMKTDIKEHKNSYELDIDLPGFEKGDIKMDIENGYLTINAEANHSEDNEEKGKFIRRERYYGKCSRSFYVGDDVKAEDVKASFKNGILVVNIPKIDSKKEIENKKYIDIEG